MHSIYARTPTVPVTIQRDATVALDYVLFVDTAAKDSARGGDTDAVATLMWERMGRAALLDTPHAQRNFKNASLGLFAAWQERHFCAVFYIKCIILPRQARDKHKENSKKMAFPIAACQACHMAWGGGAARVSTPGEETVLYSTCV